MGNRTTTLRRRVLSSVAATLVVGSEAGAGWGTHSMLAPWDPSPFDAAPWRSAHSEPELRERARIVGDLIRTHLNAGMTEKATTKVLGQPERMWPKEGGEPHDVPQYDMGHAPMDFAGQHDLLRLHVDGDGRLRSAGVTRD